MAPYFGLKPFKLPDMSYYMSYILDNIYNSVLCSLSLELFSAQRWLWNRCSVDRSCLTSFQTLALSECCRRFHARSCVCVRCVWVRYVPRQVDNHGDHTGQDSAAVCHWRKNVFSLLIPTTVGDQGKLVYGSYKMHIHMSPLNVCTTVNDKLVLRVFIF